MLPVIESSFGCAVKVLLGNCPSKVNTGSTCRAQKQQIVELIRPHAPDAVVDYVPRAEDPRDYRVSFARITERLGFHASVTVADGIAEVARLVTSGIVPEPSLQAVPA
jgi:nucleoside-diphosphate-sugar epimerase